MPAVWHGSGDGSEIEREVVVTAAVIWSDDQIYILRTLYPSKGWKAVHELTGRPKHGIIQKANKLGITLDPDARYEIMCECAAHAREVKENPPAATLPTDATRVLNIRW